MLSWNEITANASCYFTAVKWARESIEVQTDRLHCWIGLEPIVVVGVASVMLVARLDETIDAGEPTAVRVMLPVERLDWRSLKEACEEAARVAVALADPKDCS